MTHHDPVPGHSHEPVAEPPPPRDPGTSWTGYALVKYGFIFLIVVAILFFIAKYLLPAF